MKKSSSSSHPSDAENKRVSFEAPFQWTSKPDPFICLVLVIITVIVFGQVVRFDFVNYDDDLYITENAHTKAGLTLANIAWAFTTMDVANWHPLTWLSHMLDVQLFGITPGAHHGVNVLFHAINAVLLYLLLKRMTGHVWPSAFAAALFAVHPLHVESVAWVSERKDVLSTFFWLLTMAAYAAYVNRPGVGRYLLVGVLFAVGLMAKPMLVTLPAVLLLLDYWPLGRYETRAGKWPTFRRLIVEKLPFFALSALSSVVTFVAQRSSRSMAALTVLPLPLRIENALVAYARYLMMTFFPKGLCVYYPHPGSTLPVWQVVAAGLVLAAISLLALWSARRLPYVLVGWCWYLGALVPVIGVVQVGAQALADRYTYVPLIGVFIVLAWGMWDLGSWVLKARLANEMRPESRTRTPRLWLIGPAVIWIVVLSTAAMIQVSYWQNGKTLFERALRTTSNNSLAHFKLGMTLFDEGDLRAAGEHFAEAIRIDPGFAPAYNNLGRLLAKQGKVQEAISYYRKAVALDPDDARMYQGLGNELAKQGRVDEAIAFFRDALRIHPDDPLTHNSLGLELAAQGKLDEAIEHYTKALRLDPQFTLAHNFLGNALVEQGKFEEGIAHFAAALAIDPKDTIADYSWGCALVKQGKPQEAVSRFEESLRKNPADPEIHDALGFALVKVGRIDAAIQHFTIALRINPNDENARKTLNLLRTVEGTR
jgi:tetratricopeptide (TPR) repeat protein